AEAEAEAREAQEQEGEPVEAKVEETGEEKPEGGPEVIVVSKKQAPENKEAEITDESQEAEN
ncbi:MAG: hypothetical protein PVG49_22080, partial [Desulfobacteraceae bacterium]